MQIIINGTAYRIDDTFLISFQKWKTGGSIRSKEIRAKFIARLRTSPPKYQPNRLASVRARDRIVAGALDVRTLFSSLLAERQLSGCFERGRGEDCAIADVKELIAYKVQISAGRRDDR